MFGYNPHVIEHPLANKQTFLMATPEKALLDYLYLNPFYNSTEELESLRLDEDFIAENLNRKLIKEYLQKFQCNALEKRINNLLRIYD